MDIKKTLKLQLNKLKELSEDRVAVSNEIYNIFKSRYTDIVESCTDRAYLTANAKRMYENTATYTLHIFREEAKSIYGDTRGKDYTKMDGGTLDYSSDFGQFISNRAEIQVLTEMLIDILCNETASAIACNISISPNKVANAGLFIADVLKLLTTECYTLEFAQEYSSKYEHNITSFELDILNRMNEFLGDLLNIFGVKSLITNNEVELTLLTRKRRG